MRSVDLKRESQASLNGGSKSFAFAALFFSREIREDVAHLYSWCRKCDDVTDGSVLGFDQNPQGLPADRVEVLRHKSRLAVGLENSSVQLAPSPTLEPPFLAFGYVIQKYRIPWTYVEDLLAGMSQDAELQSFRTLDELLLYCYRVAGTVGLMMCHMMGVKSDRALKNAVDLGIALQLTNILRDIGDDFRVRRVYLPTEMLEEFQIPTGQFLDSNYTHQLEALCQKLSGELHRRFDSGMEGLIDLPWRSALAVAIAAAVYREIGTQVLKRGSQAWRVRVSLTNLKLFFASFKGVCFFLKTLPIRLIHPRSLAKIEEIWRYS